MQLVNLNSIKSLIRNKYVAVFLLSVMILLFLLLLYVQDYSMVDIDADNYEKKLTKSDENIFKAGVHQIFEDDWYIILTKGAKSCSGFEITEDKSTDGRPFVTLLNREKDLRYEILWEDNDYKNESANFFSVGTMNGHFSMILKDALNNLIIKEGFVLKESLFTYGRDIIIKETKDAFFIGSLSSKYSNGVGFIAFTAYKKRKYFQFL